MTQSRVLFGALTLVVFLVGPAKGQGRSTE